ncbi:mannose-1-phosphate guanylyltransferase [Tabrizicola sp. BL-A-41-H6]|uniref:mannose-1-phosphate guanylyltransferase n=1 Tax=Tabrizicola sp. BL-A-41-H6 TaxID=3421107 RepID=UPI003D66D06B
MQKIYPLVLCGGMGARLWPMSRIEQPKQFQPVNGKGSPTYFQTTVQRHRGPLYHSPIVVTAAGQADLVSQQLVEIQSGGRIIAEPCGRNTGPAVLAAALSVLADDPDAMLLVLPSDHMIFGDLTTPIARMVPAAAAGRIIMFGITPGYAETGYGYIIDGGADADHDGLHSVSRFIEKPPVDIAQRLIDQGTAYWASGISLFRADVISDEFRRLDPATHAAVSAAVQLGHATPGGLFLDDGAFREARNEPTERSVFENSPLVSLARLDVKWDDVGAWPAVYDVAPKTAAGNVTNGDVMALDTTNSLIRSDGRLVVVIGMKDVIVVDTKDALLVTDREHAQHVKQAVEQLKGVNRAEVNSHPYRSYSWGGIEALASEAEYKVDMLTLRPGAALRINGRGRGTRFLSVLVGEANCLGTPPIADRTLSPGSMLTIENDAEVSLTNTADHDLRAVLLSTMQAEVDQPERMAATPLRVVANG